MQSIQIRLLRVVLQSFKNLGLMQLVYHVDMRCITAVAYVTMRVLKKILYHFIAKKTSFENECN